MKGMNEMEELDQVMEELGRSFMVLVIAAVFLILLFVGWVFS